MQVWIFRKISIFWSFCRKMAKNRFFNDFIRFIYLFNASLDFSKIFDFMVILSKNGKKSFFKFKKCENSKIMYFHDFWRKQFFKFKICPGTEFSGTNFIRRLPFVVRPDHCPDQILSILKMGLSFGSLDYEKKNKLDRVLPSQHSFIFIFHVRILRIKI